MRTPEAMASKMPTILNSLGRVTDLVTAEDALAVAEASVLTIFGVGLDAAGSKMPTATATANTRNVYNKYII